MTNRPIQTKKQSEFLISHKRSAFMKLSPRKCVTSITVEGHVMKRSFINRSLQKVHELHDRCLWNTANNCSYAWETEYLSSLEKWVHAVIVQRIATLCEWARVCFVSTVEQFRESILFGMEIWSHVRASGRENKKCWIFSFRRATTRKFKESWRELFQGIFVLDIS